MKRAICLILICFHAFTLQAQNGNSLFRDTVLHRINLLLENEGWLNQLEQDYKVNSSNPESAPEIYRVCSVIVDGIRLDSCGIRIKGNFSYAVNLLNKKKSFKIAFNQFRNQKYDGLTKINLNNGTNDPSMIREALSYKLLRDVGVSASRCSFTKIYINGEYWGLYELVEDINQPFLTNNFGKQNDDGNLFKTTQQAGVNFDWNGTDTSNYVDNGISLKNNSDHPSWSRYIEFLDIINHQPQKLDSVFDVKYYLKILAVEKLIYSWDSYWGGGNNFYLYQHPKGQFVWIPWDYNETFQEHGPFLNLLLPKDYYLIPSDKFDKRPLLKAIFSQPENRDYYLEQICYLINNEFKSETLAPQLIKWHDLISEAYRADPNSLNSFAEFQYSIDEGSSEWIESANTGIAIKINYPGLLPFIASRAEWASEQLEAYNYDCTVNESERNTYKLSCWPNPFIDGPSIEWPVEIDAAFKIEITNVYGTIIFKSNWITNAEHKIHLNLSTLQPGIYFIQKTDANGGIGTAKVIKR